MKKFALLIALLLSVLSFAQQHKIKGIIIDSDTRPIPGANIVIEQTGALTITDFNGNFSFYTERIPINIIVSYIG
jgi:hypothetical protein